MTVLSTNKISSGMGLSVAGLGAVATAILLRRSFNKGHEEDRSAEPERDRPKNPTESSPVECDPSLKSRIGNFKISKLKKLVLGIAEELDSEIQFDWDRAAQGCVQTGGEKRSTEYAIDTNNETEWEREACREQQTFLRAADILHEVRGSATHRKLQHFYVVDRQLSQLEAQFREISENVLEFPWREHRDDPIIDLMKLPFMSLAADGGHEAILPVSQGFVKHTASQVSVTDTERESLRIDDEILLGVNPDVNRESLQSAFRHKARNMHAHGHCIKIEEFHELNNAYMRCQARMTNSGWKNAYRGGSTSILAHYLLIGTDPSESRYGEAVTGLLDALQRERLLTRLDVLRSWGEVSGTATGLGNG